MCLHLHASVYLVSLLYSLCNNTPIRGVISSSHHMQGLAVVNFYGTKIMKKNLSRETSPKRDQPL
jgi:hypothetical protein